MYKQFLAVLALTVSLSVFTHAATYSGGDGTEASPYQISTVNDWMELIGTSADWNMHFTLTATIDFEGATITPVAPDTDPSSEGFKGTPFTGIFDGGGYVLRNFVIDRPASDYVGLFGQVEYEGQVRNLGVEPIQVTGRYHVGGLCGWNHGGTITSCYAAGAVSGSPEYSECVGGLCGENFYHSTITSCYATGTVSGTSKYVGGLCGRNYGTITSCYATGTVSGKSNVGGLCGQNNFGTITSCCATGAVTGTSEDAGGLCGWNWFGTITSCYATGTVSGYYAVGGLCGGGVASTITSCYATGAVSGSPEYSEYVGGLCGRNYGTISASFWDTQTSGRTTSAGGSGVQGQITVEMQTLSMFTSAGWDFTNETINGTNDYWRMCTDGKDYPRLSWESIDGDFACPNGVSTEDIYYYSDRWLINDCATDNNYCGGADLNYSGTVDLADLSILAANWLR